MANTISEAAIVGMVGGFVLGFVLPLAFVSLYFSLLFIGHAVAWPLKMIYKVIAS